MDLLSTGLGPLDDLIQEDNVINGLRLLPRALVAQSLPLGSNRSLGCVDLHPVLAGDVLSNNHW